PQPGLPPGSQSLAQLITELPAKGVRAILYSAYEDPRACDFVAERIGATAVMLPFTVGGSDRAKDLFGLFDDTIDRLTGPLAGAAIGKRWFGEPASAVSCRAAGAGDTCASGPTCARTRDCLHRSGDRPGRRARRRCRRRDGVGAARLVRAS